MPANKLVTLGPVFVASSAGNLFSPPSLTLSGGTNNPPPATTWQTVYILRHVRITNNNATATTVTLYKDATGGSTAGKEVMWAGTSIAGNSYVEWFGAMRIASSETDKFLTGIASAATRLTIEAEAEIGIE